MKLMSPEKDAASSLRNREWGVDLDAPDLPTSEIGFLRELGGPTLLHLRGADGTRTRVVTTLLHGNEPSGLRAIHRWLREARRPATNVLFFIARIDAALREPPFSVRHLPDRRDFNRCFRPPWCDEEGRLAKEVLDRILAVGPECLVDLHNNTGHNPAYGVAVRIDVTSLALISLYADRVVHAPLALGTLVEATIDHFPSVTIECGRSGDPAADETAYRGLARTLEEDDLHLEAFDGPMSVLEDPIRVCVTDAAGLAFGEAPDADADLTISADIDRHNFERLSPGTPIGWIRPGSAWPLDARRPDGTECSHEMFRTREGILETRFEFIPIMMTTRPEIAKSDCLFYAVREGSRTGRR